ncbi:unnamed protein product, partial [Alternaria alternata]
DPLPYSEAPAYKPASSTAPDSDSLFDTSERQLQMEKSNVLILGPTGVGKTLMCKTLAKTLGLPISIASKAREERKQARRYMPGGPQPPGPGGNKGEVFNIRTDNILFICTGAFSNLHKIVLDRKSKGSMGFGASIRTSNAHAAADGVMLTGPEAESFKKDSPFFVPPKNNVPNPFGVRQIQREERINVLDHVQPADLQKFGMIPELIGRIPTVCAVAALDEEALVRVLTEPKDSLIRQEEHKSYLRNIELRFTNGALREIARKAGRMGTGARSSVKHILVTQDVALLKRAPLYFHRGQSAAFEAAHAQEEERFEEELRSQEDPTIASGTSNFQEYRKASAAGF